jgi:hypothetical protein
MDRSSLYEIQFAQEGNFDLLTNLYSAKFLYNYLDREMAQAKRLEESGKNYPLGFITFKFPPEYFVAASDKNIFASWHNRVAQNRSQLEKEWDIALVREKFRSINSTFDGRKFRGDLPAVRRGVLVGNLTSYERELIANAKNLERQLREGDFLARPFETGFLLVARSSEKELAGAVKRLSTFLPSKANIQSLSREKGESKGLLFERLDELYFS